MSNNRKTRREKERHRLGLDAVKIQRENDALKMRVEDMQGDLDAEREKHTQLIAAERLKHETELTQLAQRCRADENELRLDFGTRLTTAQDAAVELRAQLEVAKARVAELEARMPNYDKLHKRLQTKSTTITELQKKINGLLRDTNRDV